MENASKALIIAGAILLSILIIGLGMGVYNNSRNATEFDFSDSEIAAINSKFEPYEGGNQKGSAVRNLISAVLAYNTSNAETNGAGDTTAIKIYLDNAEVTSASSIVNKKTYSVGFGYDSTTGLINAVAIVTGRNVTVTIPTTK